MSLLRCPTCGAPGLACRCPTGPYRPLFVEVPAKPVERRGGGVLDMQGMWPLMKAIYAPSARRR